MAVSNSLHHMLLFFLLFIAVAPRTTFGVKAVAAAAGPVSRNSDEIDTNRANEDPITNPGERPSMEDVAKPEPVSRELTLIGKANVVVPITEAPPAVPPKGDVTDDGATVNEGAQGGERKQDDGGERLAGDQKASEKEKPAVDGGLSEEDRAAAEVLTSLVGAAAFKEAVEVKSMVFVKFFSPRCPHCRAMKQAFVDTAKKIKTSAMAVAVTEVDCTNIQNRLVCDDHVPAGYPTLKLFKNGNLFSEFTGPRDAENMFTWVEKQVIFDNAPRVAPIKTEAGLTAFLRQMSDHPVILAAVQPNVTRAELLNEWKMTVDVMRDSSAKNVAFAVVEQWQLLVAASGSKRRASFDKANKYGVPPFAVGASSSKSLIEGSAQWFFDGVTGADSLETFMHLASLPNAGRAVLTPENAPYVTASQRVLSILFDKSSGPSWAMEDMLDKLAKESQVVPLYASSHSLSSFRAHVGFRSLQETVSVADFGRMDFAVYRAASGGVEKAIYMGQGRTVQDMMKWTLEYLKWGINMTSRATAPADLSSLVSQARRVPLVVPLNVAANALDEESVALTQAPVVDVVASTWSGLVERDGRTVLMLLYSGHCGACRAFLPTFTAAAQLLRRDARSVFAARMDIANNEVPPYLPRPNRVPAVYILVPGAAPALYKGSSSAEAIAAFSRYSAAPPHLKEALRLSDFVDPPQRTVSPAQKLLWSLCSLALFLIGTWVIGVGVLLELSRMRLRRKYNELSPSRMSESKSALSELFQLGELKVQ